MAYNPDPRLVDAIVSTAPAGDRAIALAVALVESGGRLDAVGDGGRSHGPYQEYDAGRGAGIPIAGRRDPVAATQRFIRELSQYRRRGFTGGELAYRTQRPADHGGYVRKINAALPEAKRILAGYGGGSGSALPAGAAPGLRAPAGRGATSPASAAGLRLTPALEAKLSRYLARSREQVMMGETPDDPLEIVQGISRLQPAPLVTDYGGRTRATREATTLPPMGIIGGLTMGGGPEGHHSRALGNWQSDDAYDLMGKAGQPVYSPFEGVVTGISGQPGGRPQFAGYGVTIRTPHGSFFFKHLGSTPLKVGARVGQGAIIGTLDAATAGGPHLHLGGTNIQLLHRIAKAYTGAAR